MDHGEFVFEKSIDELLFGNAIIHCTREQMNGIDKKNVVACHEENDRVTALIRNCKDVESRYADLAVTQASIDEILKVMIKGA